MKKAGERSPAFSFGDHADRKNKRLTGNSILSRQGEVARAA
jgi:hypothetical protein